MTALSGLAEGHASFSQADICSWGYLLISVFTVKAGERASKRDCEGKPNAKLHRCEVPPSAQCSNAKI